MSEAPPPGGRDLVAVGPGPSKPHEEPAPRSIEPADLEALLFVAERPLTRRELAGLCGVATAAIDALLGDLEVELANRGIRLVSAGERVELATRRESGDLVARYLGTDELRLSPAALEVLAIVAYRQPVTRGVIERIRGVDSDHVVRGLLHRRLIVEQGRADTPGRPILYATGLDFMESFGLASLDELPPLEAEVAARLVDAQGAGADGEEGPDPYPRPGGPGDPHAAAPEGAEGTEDAGHMRPSQGDGVPDEVGAPLDDG